MKKSDKNMSKENWSIPILLLKLVKHNWSGKKKYTEKTYYYGAEKQQKLIIIVPKTKFKDKTIFFSNGGGWAHGGAKNFRFIGYFFAEFGYTTIIAEYRKVPQYVYPIQVEDTINALQLGIKKVEELGIFNNKVIMVGQSAGAHLVTLVTYSDVLTAFGFEKDIIKGVISISGPINFTECKNDYINKLIMDLVKDEINRKKADPYRYITGSEKIPLLCIHGEDDPVVEITNSISFVNKINKLNGDIAELMIVKNGLHSNLVKLFFKEFDEYKKMLHWIESK